MTDEKRLLAFRPLVTAERLREVLSYDPETGTFTWRVSGGGRRTSGVAGHHDRAWKGYVCIAVDGRKYRAQRLAFLYMTGDWPPAQIDHINGDTSDNRWANL